MNDRGKEEVEGREIWKRNVPVPSKGKPGCAKRVGMQVR